MTGLIADDLTGACDSAAPFLSGGRVVVTIWPALPAAGSAECLAVSTESRSDVEAPEARARTRKAVAHLAGESATLLFKKVDSRLRGEVRAELEGALEAWPGTILLAPALPGEGRITRDGLQLTPEEEIDLRAMISGLERVRLLDAATDADLDRVAEEVLACQSILPAGTAGLAAALARRLPNKARSGPAWPAVHNPLGLVGSKTETSAEQVERARAAGWEVRRRSRDDAVELDGHDALFLSGGSTAAGVITALGASALELAGEVLPRIPVGRLRGGPHEGLTVCLKSGGFGGPDAIDDALRRLCHGA